MKHINELLSKYNKNPSILEGKVVLKMNSYTKTFYLMNKYNQTALINPKKEERPLELWISCPHCGNEGFMGDYHFIEGICQDCEQSSLYN